MIKWTGFLEKELRVKHILFLVFFFVIILLVAKLLSGAPVSLNQANGQCDTCGIGITDLVRRVKKELIQLEDSMIHKNENKMFKLKDMQMEISFVVRQTAAGKFGASYELVTVEGSNEQSNEKVQKLILHWDADTSNENSGILLSPIPLNNFVDSIKKSQ